MKKLLIIFAFLNFNLCLAQTFSAVKVYIGNPYVERVRCITTQLYNMDYIRSHYASCVFSMERNYINTLFDSLQSFSMTKVAHDSINLFVNLYWGSGHMDMNFEPCIVIDFIRGNRYNTDDDVWTFAVNKQATPASNNVFFIFLNSIYKLSFINILKRFDRFGEVYICLIFEI